MRRRYYGLGATAAAAAVLLVAGLCWYRYDEGHRDRQVFIAQQKDVVHEIDAQLAALEPGFKRKAQALERKLRAAAPPHLYVMGPTHIHPDGGEAVRVVVKDLDGKPLDRKVTVSLADAASKRILSCQEAVTRDGAATVHLGDGLGKAQRGEWVQMIAEVEGGARCQESLQVAAPAYVAHLITSKSVYRPRELLFCRALVLDRAGLTPPVAPIALQFTLLDAKGNAVAAVNAATGPGGIAAGELAVLDQWADGEYELRVAALKPGTPEVRPHTRRLQVARDIYFEARADRDRYRAGDTVNLGLSRMAQAAPAKSVTNVTANSPNVTLMLNGKQVPLQQGQNNYWTGPAAGNIPGGAGGGGAPVPSPPVAPPATPPQLVPGRAQDGGGASRMQSPAAQLGGQGYGGFDPSYANNTANQLNFQFALPNDIETCRVRVRIVLTEAGKQETFEQDLACVPSRLAVDLLPEGGDLIAGVPNRVYYQVRSALGEPVNPEGRVIVLSSSDVLLDSAPGEGAGSFTFTPKAGDTYTVRITTPDGVPPADLPDPFAGLGGARDDGLVLHTPQPVAAEGEPVAVVLRNPGPPRRVLLVAQCRGQFVGQQWAEAKGPETAVAMGTLAGARGLVRLTAYEAGNGALKPLAERLIYRTPAQRLDVTALHLGGVIAPRMGQRTAQLELRARDQAGVPCPAWTTALVVDDRFRAREPSPLAHFLILGDVSGSEDLDNAALLAADMPQARQALDLFLGTAGWRRFEPAPAKALAAAGPTASMFSCQENSSPRELQRQQEARLDDVLAPVRLAVRQQRAKLTSDRRDAQGVLDQSRAELRDYEALPQEYFRLGLYLATLTLFSLACLSLVVGAWRLVRRHHATPLFAGSFACLGLCLIAMLLVTSLAPPTDVLNRTLAKRPADDLLPSWLNLPGRHDVRDGPPIGQFALAPLQLRRAAGEAKLMDAVAKNDRNDAPTTESKDANRFGLAMNARGGALATAPSLQKDGAEKTQVVRELQDRFAVAKETQERAALKPMLQPPSSTAAPVPAARPAARVASRPWRRRPRPTRSGSASS